MQTARKSAPENQSDLAGEGLHLATLLRRETPATFVVRVGGREQTAVLDPSVDPALVDEALGRGGRVVVARETHGLCIVGTLQTARSLTMDRQGNVEATVERFTLDVRRAALIRGAQAFFRVEGGEVELYGQRVLTRAREVAKVLARMISLN